MKLKRGMRVMTARGAVALRGRNGCFPEQWWGHPVIDGKTDRKHIMVLTARDVTALPVREGWQGVLPGLLKG